MIYALIIVGGVVGFLVGWYVAVKLHADDGWE